MKTLCVVIAFLVCYADARIKTVDELDLTKYDGRWYEVRSKLDCYFLKELRVFEIINFEINMHSKDKWLIQIKLKSL